MPARGLSARDFQEAADLRGALRRFQQRTAQVLPRHGLTSAQYQLLLVVKTAANGEGEEFAAIADRLGIARSTATELVRRVEEAGLVERRLHPHDRRALLVALTTEGAARLEAAVRALRGDRERLISILQALV
ncbi:MAG TPA: MarR family transcriptional regulator [Gaiellaceae bacterium]|jgi:DNA-binding MarR family transcriptional regulator